MEVGFVAILTFVGLVVVFNTVVVIGGVAIVVLFIF